MQCQFAQELFSDHLSDSLDRAQKVSLENHLATCADCKEQVAGLRDVWAALDTLPVVEPPKFFHENIMDRIATEAAKEQEAALASKSQGWDWRSLFRARSLAFGAAALVLLLGAFSVTQATHGGMFDISGWFAKSAPAAPLTLQTATTAWKADENGGILTVTLRANPLPDNGVNKLNFTIKQGDTTLPKSAGVVASDRDTTVNIPLTTAPVALSITLSDSQDTSRTAPPTLLPTPAP